MSAGSTETTCVYFLYVSLSYLFNIDYVYLVFAVSFMLYLAPRLYNRVVVGALVSLAVGVGLGFFFDVFYWIFLRVYCWLRILFSFVENC